jgi:hypothetical protein
MEGSAQDAKVAGTVHLESVAPHDYGRFASEVDAQRGAAILEEENQLSLWYNAKLHWRALLICKSCLRPWLAKKSLTDQDPQVASPSQRAWPSATTPS